MEFINQQLLTMLMMKPIKPLVLFFSIVILQSCGSNLSKSGEEPVYTPQLVVEQKSTLTFIPIPKVDKEGKAIPYVPSANPYLKKKSTIDKASVENFIVAKRALKAGDLELAEQSLTTITETNKRLSGPWVMLSDIALDKNDIDKADKFLSRAIAINKYNVNAYLRLAKVKRIQGKFKEAQQTYFDVLSIWPDFPEAHLNLGLLYDIYMNETVKAQKHVEAYQFLTNGANETVAVWLQEIQKRTGVPPELDARHVVAQTGSSTI